MPTHSNPLKVRRCRVEMINKVSGEIYFADFYLIGNPRKALRRQIALAYVLPEKDGDQWWISDPAFEPIKQMTEANGIKAFLQFFVDKDPEKYAAAVVKAEAMK